MPSRSVAQPSAADLWPLPHGLPHGPVKPVRHDATTPIRSTPSVQIGTLDGTRRRHRHVPKWVEGLVTFTGRGGSNPPTDTDLPAQTLASGG